MRLKRSLAGAFEGGAGGLGVGAGATGLSKQQLEEMMEMCLKLAAENKITAGNAWGLRLIDMLPDIIRGEDRSGACTWACMHEHGWRWWVWGGCWHLRCMTSPVAPTPKPTTAGHSDTDT